MNIDIYHCDLFIKPFEQAIDDDIEVDNRHAEGEYAHHWGDIGPGEHYAAEGLGIGNKNACDKNAENASGFKDSRDNLFDSFFMFEGVEGGYFWHEKLREGV